jgi:environmental stress-induced protein Ves
VCLDGVAAQRWRNGGGWTRELLAEPAGDHWRVRVSVAEIEADGPFSSFPGVQRHFAVLEGAGVALTVDGTTHRVTRDSGPVSFAGEATTTCRLLGGPTRDLNLMVRGPQGVLHAASPGAAWRPSASACGLFTGEAGECRSDGGALSLPARALAWFDPAPATLWFSASGWWLAA